MSFTYASWITQDGQVTSSNDLRLTPLRTAQVAGRVVPVDWRIELPSQGLDITTSALNDESWQATLFPYWEGPVTASGTHEGQGYLEMTGY
jgi:predicted secreted hydrolase